MGKACRYRCAKELVSDLLSAQLPTRIVEWRRKAATPLEASPDQLSTFCGIWKFQRVRFRHWSWVSEWSWGPTKQGISASPVQHGCCASVFRVFVAFRIGWNRNTSKIVARRKADRCCSMSAHKTSLTWKSWTATISAATNRLLRQFRPKSLRFLTGHHRSTCRPQHI